VLRPGEKVLQLGGLHWIIYRNAIGVFILSIVAFSVDGGSSSHVFGGLMLLAASMLLAMAAWLDQWITEIAVTDRRVMLY
jgi:hypothetical protein